jgi:hypothetical protein
MTTSEKKYPKHLDPPDPSRVRRSGDTWERFKQVIEKYSGRELFELEIYRLSQDMMNGSHAARVVFKGYFHGHSRPAYFVGNSHDLSVETLEEVNLDEWPPPTRRVPSFL